MRIVVETLSSVRIRSWPVFLESLTTSFIATCTIPWLIFAPDWRAPSTLARILVLRHHCAGSFLGRPEWRSIATESSPCWARSCHPAQPSPTVKASAPASPMARICALETMLPATIRRFSPSPFFAARIRANRIRLGRAIGKEIRTRAAFRREVAAMRLDVRGRAGELGRMPARKSGGRKSAVSAFARMSCHRRGRWCRPARSRPDCHRDARRGEAGFRRGADDLHVAAWRRSHGSLRWRLARMAGATPTSLKPTALQPQRADQPEQVEAVARSSDPAASA